MAKKRAAKKAVTPKPEAEEAPAFEVQNEETVEVQESQQKISLDEASSIPFRDDPDWTDYVINQLAEDEKFEDKPKSDGLRRLVEKLIGPIIGIDTQIIQAPSVAEGPDNIATVVSRIQVLDQQLKKPIMCSGSADASSKTCAAPFNRYLTAMAETRAEARAYKKLLRLKNVVTSDEIGHTEDMPQKLPTVMVTAVDNQCKNSNLCVRSVFETVLKKAPKSSIRNYTEEEGKQVLAMLSDYAVALQNGTKSADDKKLADYDSSWREYFG